MDLLLLSYLHSPLKAERDRTLSELVLVRAAPVVRHTLRQRLNFYVDHTGANPDNPEAEDLYQDIIAKLIERLHEAKADPERQEIRDIRQYVTRVAVNACNDYLRGKSPARSRLKDNLRDLLDRHPDFLLWRGGAGETLCGFRVWEGRNITHASSEKIKQLENMPEAFIRDKFPRESVQQVSLTRLVAEVFDWVGGPIDIERLVGAIVRLHGVRDHNIESLDDEKFDWQERLVDSTVRCDTRVEAREMLARLWEEIRRLPEKQRDTICLSFEDSTGEDLFSLLLDAEVGTLPQIASELGLSLERLTTLWRDMPMDSARIAAELGASRQQVNKWRFRALKGLEKQMSVCLEHGNK